MAKMQMAGLFATLSGMKKIDPQKLEKAIALYEGGCSIKQVVGVTGIGKSTIYRELDKRGIQRHSERLSGEA